MSAKLAESSASCECRCALQKRETGQHSLPLPFFFFTGTKHEARDGATYELSRLDRAARRGHGLALRAAARVHVQVPRRHLALTFGLEFPNGIRMSQGILGRSGRLRRWCAGFLGGC